ncbi:MAG: threonylcarbamoyl-AMP synthase [Bacteroidales bacterium]|nr:threonylcarbamoyl-AMP synthase [Bacteroidales bacterium]
MEKEIENCVERLLAGEILLYPTDTVWGIGCDATNEKAIQRIYELKQRNERKSMLVLLDKKEKLPYYVKNIPAIAWDLLAKVERPTTFIYPTAQNLPSRLVPLDGTIAIRIVDSEFCKKIIAAMNRPLISTSANISGSPSPASFDDIAPEIINGVDYVVPQQYNTSTNTQPSSMIRFIDDNQYVTIR